MNYKTAVAFAREVRKVIDDYWKLVASKEDLIDKVTIIAAKCIIERMNSDET